MELQYFGTNLTEHGHYRWKLNSEYFSGGTLFFKDLPFLPENLTNPLKGNRGDVSYWWTAGYTICRIEGSCKDTRPGTKSVFWVREHITPAEMKAVIMANQLGIKIIHGMPFKVEW